HVLDDLSPADSGVIRAEGNLAFLCSVRYHAHFSAAEIVNEQILEPHSFNTEDSPRVFIATILHSIILVGIRRGRRRFEQLNQVADREPFWRFARIVIAQDSHPK